MITKTLCIGTVNHNRNLKIPFGQRSWQATMLKPKIIITDKEKKVTSRRPEDRKLLTKFVKWCVEEKYRLTISCEECNDIIQVMTAPNNIELVCSCKQINLPK